MLTTAEPIENVRPAPCIPLLLGLRRAGSKTSSSGKAGRFAVVEDTRPECCPVLAVACLLIQSQPSCQDVFLKGDDCKSVINVGQLSLAYYFNNSMILIFFFLVELDQNWVKSTCSYVDYCAPDASPDLSHH